MKSHFPCQTELYVFARLRKNGKKYIINASNGLAMNIIIGASLCELVALSDIGIYEIQLAIIEYPCATFLSCRVE